MKVALINKNPAVSRLITLSLEKVGADYDEFEEVSELEEKVDFIIIDSDIQASDEELKNFSEKIMYLVPRGKMLENKLCLEKPFLPTEFITIFEEDQKPKEAENTEINTSDELESGEENFDNLTDIDSLNDFGDLKLDSGGQISDTAEEGSLDLKEIVDSGEESEETAFTDNLGGNENAERDLLAALDADELGDDLKTLDDDKNLSDDLGGEDLQSLDDSQNTSDETSIDEIGSVLDEIDKLPSNPQVDEGEKDSFDANENLDDDLKDDIEQIKNTLDEIDSVDEGLDANLADLTADESDKASESLSDLNIDENPSEDLSNLDEGLSD
ncbi:MAG: hypothetical protein K5978_07430, partial [Campylobacter sp.]|nr:hypothetical protein [Campylobacter sp.]